MGKKIRIAWIFPGGGNQASYGCGACKAAIDLGLPKPDVIIASSGGAANAYYYLANQIDTACDIWGNRISSKEILNGARFWRMFNRDLMIDGVFTQPPEPLDLDSVRSSPIDLFVGVTDKKTGKLEFFSNRDDINLLQLLKATMTVPFFSGIKDLSIQLNGSRYLDSRISSRQELLIDRALSFDPESVIVFGGHMSHNYRYAGNFWYSAWVYSMVVQNQSFEFARNHFAEMERQRAFVIPHGIDVLHLCSKERFKVAPWTNTKEFLQMAVEQGYKDTVRRLK